MKSRRFLRAWIASVILIVSFESSLAASILPQNYHTFSELSKFLSDIVEQHQDIAALQSIGKTRSGMDIWMVKISNLKKVEELERPAICVVANLEGNHIVGSEMALFTIQHLLENYGKIDSITQLIDTQTFYIIPRVNPEAAESMFKRPLIEQQTNFTPVDDDFDGRADEDGPEDLNEDGYITLMRIPDSLGSMIPDPDEPRLLRKADPAKSETGRYRIETEGFDNDGDGKINEDMPGGVDINRNFPQEYPEYEHDAGPFMGSESETQAILNFISMHKNISVLLTYSFYDNLLQMPMTKGKSKSQITRKQDDRSPDSRSQRSRPREVVTEISEQDIPYFNEISAQYKKLTKIEAKPDQPQAKGALHQWAYFQQGIWAFSARVWWQPKIEPEESKQDSSKDVKSKSIEQDSSETPDKGTIKKHRERKKEDSDTLTADRQWLKLSDEKYGGDAFIEWRSFEHPRLGKVEIGGFKPYFRRNPPAEQLLDLGPKHALFLAYLAGLLPEVKIAKVDIDKKGTGVYLISAEISNTGYLPTVPDMAIQTDATPPTRVTLTPNSCQLLSGEVNTFIKYLPGSGHRHKIEWLVHGTKGSSLKIQLFSPKAGSDTRDIKLN